MAYLQGNLVNKSLKVLLLKVLGVTLFFGLSLFLTNFYPASDVGRYDFVRAWLLILGGICMLGTNQAIIYYSGVLQAQNSLGSLRKIYQKMIGIVIATNLLFLLVVWIIPENLINAFFDKEDAAALLFKVVISLSAFAITLLNIDTLRGLKRPLFSELYRNVFRYTPFFLAAIVLYFTNHLTWLVEAYLLGFVLLAVISTLQVFFAFRNNSDPATVDAIGYNKIIKKSYPMAISAVSFFFMQSTDIVLLGKFKDFDTVAFYAVAVKLGMVTTLVLQSVTIILAPKIAEIYKLNDQSQLKKIVKDSARLIFMLSVPIIGLLMLFPSFFLSFFGEAYTAATNAFLILLGAQFINTLLGPISIYMNMTGKQNKLHQILLLGFIINLVLNWYLIPLYGMVGAATATAISMVLWKSIAVGYTWNKDRIKTFLT